MTMRGSLALIRTPGNIHDHQPQIAARQQPRMQLTRAVRMQEMLVPMLPDHFRDEHGDPPPAPLRAELPD
jgi:hypothetical protein